MSGVATEVKPGTYTVYESSNADFTPSFSGDCVADEDNESRLNLISDLQDKKDALQEAIDATEGDTEDDAVKEAAIFDITEKITALLNSLSATITVEEGEDAECTITNTYTPDDGDDYGSGTLVIKKVTQFADEGNFDFDIGGNESFYDADVVVNNGEGETSLELPTGTYSLTETQQEDWEFGSVTCSYEGESAGSSIPFGHQISIYNGETVTCTFLNNYDDDSGGSGNSVNGGPSDDGDGEVLGAVASESQSCGPLLTTFMRMGIDNNGDEVIKLQDFLNGEMGLALPVTGVFGPLTDAAVRAFQLKYWEDVLQPWFGLEGSAIQDQDDSTGYVYKTTKWKINNIFCPDSEAMPVLP